MKGGQTSHTKIFYCHDIGQTVPNNLIIICRMCRKSVKRPSNLAYLNFFGTSGDPDVVEDCLSSSSDLDSESTETESTFTSTD